MALSDLANSSRTSRASFYTNFQYLTLLFSMKSRLNYYRAHAPDPASAFVSFIYFEKSMLTRLFKLGWREHLKLTRLELSCAQAGLSFRQSKESIPPWILNDDFCDYKIIDLPKHPLIEPSFLSELVDKGSSAYSALTQLLLPQGLKKRWDQVPIFSSNSYINGNSRIAVCLHLYYPDLWTKIKKSLDSIPESYDLYITLPDFACTKQLSIIAKEHSNVLFVPCNNRGRDIWPFIYLLNNGVFDHYDAVCKIHTKKSPHITKGGSQWLDQILESLLSNRKTIKSIVYKFVSDPEIGLIGPEKQLVNFDDPLYLSGNKKTLKKLAKCYSLNMNCFNRPFFGGTMFWFRPAAFEGLKKLCLTSNDFPLEMGQTDGTTAHALERLIWPLVESAGYKVICA